MKYFCGPDAKLTDKLALRAKKRDRPISWRGQSTAASNSEDDEDFDPDEEKPVKPTSRKRGISTCSSSLFLL